jgi:signal transduction histidine kinase
MDNLTPSLTPEVLVPRLGETLLKMGLLDDAQLRQVLNYQHARAAEGKPLLLGDAAVELGLLDRATVDRAVTEQILLLRQALEDANRNLERRVEQRTADLQDALRRISELNQLKVNFISNVSHELRTPLTHLKGYVELLADGSLGPINEEQAEALAVCQRSTNRLEELIDDLLMFSQASRGGLSLQLDAVDLEQLARGPLILSQLKADERGVTLETDIAPGPHLVRADGQKLAWVIAQLLDNGIKYTGRGGTVTFGIRPDPDSPYIVHVLVSDTGLGIPPERLGEIFEPFHQLDGSSTRPQGGTGLGLALVREIVEAHGSRMDVRSKVHSGTTFSFTLLSIDEQTGTP